MGNRPSADTTTNKNRSTITIVLEKPESDLKPGDIVKGFVRWSRRRSLTRPTAAAAAIRDNDNNDSDNDEDSIEGITVTVTGVEYAVSTSKSRLVVIDTFKLGRYIGFDRNGDNYSGVDDDDIIDFPFEIELPVASPEMEIDLNDFQPHGGLMNELGRRRREQEEDDDDIDGPDDALSLSSMSYSTTTTNNNNTDDDDDDDDDDDWELLSSKRHSFMASNMAQKQYAFKIKAQLKERDVR